MARDRKRSKQRQQRRARTHRDDARATAQRALGRDPDEDAGALNGAEQRDELGDQVAEARAADVVESPADDGVAAASADVVESPADGGAPATSPDEQKLQPLGEDDLPEDFPATVDPVADPTADPVFAAATEPDFDAPVRPRFEESDYDEEDESPDGGAVAGVRARPAPAARPVKGNRVTGFLRASWAELQRVQWPNRQQVFQATAVVLGFVVVAGAFLAFADFLAGKIVDAIL
jgi:preprotein translocase SecE subunit